MDNLNRLISIKLIESTNDLLKQKVPGPDEFIGEFYQKCKEKLIPILYNLLQRTEAERILSNLF